MPRPLRSTAALALALTVAACDSAPVDPPLVPPSEPPPSAAVAVERGAHLPADLFGSFGAQFQGAMQAHAVFGAEAGEPADAETKLWSTSLWLAGEQGGQARYAGVGAALTNGYAPCDDAVEYAHVSYFTLHASLDYALGEWPVDLGAPVTADGAPRVYGDVMLWDAYCTEPRDPSADARALRDVRVNTAVFQHQRADLDRVRFFRYEITNLSDAPITDLRAGFYSDPDVTQGYSFNLLGGTDRYATVYVAPTRDGGARGAVAALGILESPKGVGQAARRIEYRDAGPGATPDSRVPYTQAGLYREEMAPIYAMRGLDDLGDPIVDPTTGAAEPFMYGGDPVAGTGWLDGTLPGGERGWDLRVLQPTDAFTLAPGETVVLTAVAVLAVGDDLAGGLAEADAVFSAVEADPGLWRFPIASD